MESIAAETAIPGRIGTRSRIFGAFQGLTQNKLALAGLAILLLIVFTAILAPFIAPHDPLEQNLEQRLSSPSWEYPLGTDELGRCVLSRLVYGARVSLQIGITVVGIAASIGIVLGLIAGYRGGIVDEIIMRFVDIMLAFPGIVLALVIVGLLGTGLFNIILALTAVGWTSYTRIVRGCVLSVKERGFVEAARAMGGSHAHIMIRHILPEVMAPVIVMATLAMGWTILGAAALSFLGLGIQPPMAEWGSMLNSGRPFMRTAPYLMTFAGLAIMATVLAFNFLGDGLRDALDPGQRKRVQI